jgi:5-formyltetrahydrofolate cyclo-ligase
MLDKKKFREKVYKINKKYKDFDFSKEDQIIIDKVITSNLFIEAQAILLYYPMKNEVNTINLINYCLENNKAVALAKTFDETIEFVYINKNWKEHLINGLYHTIEPKDNNLIKNYPQNTLAIVPSLALGKNYSRLGHGKGYYDKFFSKYKNIKKLGICRKHLLFESVPTDKNDIFLDSIITSN